MPKSKVFDGNLSTDEAVYIGIDQSYSGFAITLLSADCSKYYTVVYPSTGKGVDRILSIKQFMGNTFSMFDQSTIKGVAMEGYAFGTTMAHMAGELGIVVKMTCLEWFTTPYASYPLIVPPANLKKYATGKGTGVQKNQILLSVYKNWNIEFTDDNAADSYILARMASGRSDTAVQKEVLIKLMDPKFREYTK